MSSDPRARWAEPLRLPVDATPDDATAALLRSLPGDQFVPPAERVAATNALADTSAPTGHDPDVERFLRDEVDAFAARFWSLAPGERLTAWAALSGRSADPARLAGLEPGLDVDVTPHADPTAEELATLFRELFVMRPRERSIRRNQWLLDHAADPEKWWSALAALKRTVLTVTALDPQLTTALGPDYSLSAFAEGTTQETVQRAPRQRGPSRPVELTHALGYGTAMPDPIADGVADYSARMREHLEGTEQKNRSDSRKRLLYALPVVFFLFIGLLKALTRTPSAPTTPLSPNTSQFPRDYQPPAQSTGPARTYTREQVAAFRKYEEDRPHPHNIPPAFYSDWVRDGRPEGVSKFGGRTVYLSATDIAYCQQYDRTPAGLKPRQYDDWVNAERPKTAGFYIVRP